MINKRNKEHLYHTLVMVCICTFLDYLIGIPQALSFLHIVNRNHVTIWNLIQKYHPQKILAKRKMISKYAI